jgi:hypothetical protein
MQPELDPKLEALLDAELKRLPDIGAPGNLVSQVMTVLKVRAGLPWWQRAWWDWPLAAKSAFLLLALTLVGVAGGGSALLGDEAAVYSENVSDKLGLLTPFWNLLLTLANVAQTLWDRLGEPYLLYLGVLAAVAYLVCIGAGTVFLRVASQPIQNQSK